MKVVVEYAEKPVTPIRVNLHHAVITVAAMKEMTVKPNHLYIAEFHMSEISCKVHAEEESDILMHVVHLSCIRGHGSSIGDTFDFLVDRRANMMVMDRINIRNFSDDYVTIMKGDTVGHVILYSMGGIEFEETYPGQALEDMQ